MDMPVGNVDTCGSAVCVGVGVVYVRVRQRERERERGYLIKQEGRGDHRVRVSGTVLRCLGA